VEACILASATGTTINPASLTNLAEPDGRTKPTRHSSPKVQHR
jgi:hypothetical protein